MSIDISDMRADALGLSSDNSSTQIVDENGAIIANAAWTKDEVATNGTTNQAEEFALSIADAEKATAAIKVGFCKVHKNLSLKSCYNATVQTAKQLTFHLI